MFAPPAPERYARRQKCRPGLHPPKNIFLPIRIFARASREYADGEKAGTRAKTKQTALPFGNLSEISISRPPDFRLFRGRFGATLMGSTNIGVANHDKLK
jgi:hypothetical protein